jgi:hypothetical protein
VSVYFSLSFFVSLLLCLIILRVSLYCFPPYTFCCPSTYSISSLLISLSHKSYLRHRSPAVSHRSNVRLTFLKATSGAAKHSYSEQG